MGRQRRCPGRSRGGRSSGRWRGACGRGSKNGLRRDPRRGPGDKKIAVIKASAKSKQAWAWPKPSLGRGRAKPVLEGANKADSDAAKKKLEEAGAKVEVK